MLFKLSFISFEFISQTFITVLCVFFVYKCAKYFFNKATTKQPPRANRRQLGYYEKILDMFSVERGGTGNICLVISLTSKQSFSHQHIRDALVLLAKRQPMLRAVIRKIEDEDDYFEIKEINEVVLMLDITTSDVKSSNWKDIWFENTAKQRGDGLLWRVVILQEEFIPDTEDYANTLMFNFNHSCIDGVSCVKFCKQFLNHMNQLANGTRCVEQQVASLKLLPYVTDIAKGKQIWYTFLNFMLTYGCLRPFLKFYMHRMIIRVFRTKQYNPLYSQFPPRLDVSSFSGQDRLNVNVFTESETTNILQACKANNCTVTGALMAAVHLAFCQLVEDGMAKDSTDVKLQCDFALNGQRCCDPKPHEDYLGYFLYSIDEFYMNYLTAADVNFWKIAQETTRRMQDMVRDEEYILAETLMSETMKPRELVDEIDREMSIRLSSCNFISSIGSFNFGETQDTYKLHECFVNNLGHGFPGSFSHYNLTINGKMAWQICTNTSKVDSGHAEKFISLCFGRFTDIACGHV